LLHRAEQGGVLLWRCTELNFERQVHDSIDTGVPYISNYLPLLPVITNGEYSEVFQ
jgi:hypothetical protein